jgi:hypothetical protein
MITYYNSLSFFQISQPQFYFLLYIVPVDCALITQPIIGENNKSGASGTIAVVNVETIFDA